jgi:hypothetical protein
MTPIITRDELREEDVRTAAKVMGYDLSKVPHGYQLTRDYDRQQEIVVATTLERIADFLKH